MSNKYIDISARAWLDERDGQIRITSADPALGGNVNVAVPRRTRADSVLRSALRAGGVISDPEPLVPSHEVSDAVTGIALLNTPEGWPVPEQHSYPAAALGTTEHGSTEWFDFAGQCPHLFVGGNDELWYGAALDSVVAQLRNYSISDVTLYVEDPRTKHAAYLKSDPHTAAYSSGATGDAVHEAVGLLDRRYELLAENGCASWSQLRARSRSVGPYCFVVLPRVDLLLGSRWAPGSVRSEITDLVRTGRAAGVHVIASTSAQYNATANFRHDVAVLGFAADNTGSRLLTQSGALVGLAPGDAVTPDGKTVRALLLSH